MQIMNSSLSLSLSLSLYIYIYIYTHTHTMCMFMWQPSIFQVMNWGGGGELYYILVNIVCTMWKGHTESERTQICYVKITLHLYATKEKCKTFQDGDVKKGFTDATQLLLVHVFIYTSEA